jgi:hypothetical protein
MEERRKVIVLHFFYQFFWSQYWNERFIKEMIVFCKASLDLLFQENPKFFINLKDDFERILSPNLTLYWVRANLYSQISKILDSN